MRYYLAGPMSGITQFNFPAFQYAARVLRDFGFEIISPAELDDEEDKGMAMRAMTGDPSEAGRSWGEFLARDVKIVADEVKGIIFLPGWEYSRGARLEAFVGLLQKDFEFWQFEPRSKYQPATLDRLDRERVLELVMEQTK